MIRETQDYVYNKRKKLPRDHARRFPFLREVEYFRVSTKCQNYFALLRDVKVNLTLTVFGKRNPEPLYKSDRIKIGIAGYNYMGIMKTSHLTVTFPSLLQFS